MSRYRFSRRSLLAAAGGAAALLPLLSASKGFSAVPTAPKRLFIIQTTNGVIANAFWPDDSDVNLTQPLPEILSPLESHKSDIIVLGGIDLQSALDDIWGHANSHDCAGHLLTGMQGAKGNKPGYNEAAPVANIASVDQAIAQELKRTTQLPFPSLELGVSNMTSGHDNAETQRYTSYRGPAIGSDPARPDGVLTELNPYNLYTKLFSNFMQEDTSAIDALRAERRSILDLVGSDMERLAGRLGRGDKEKIEAHLSSVRDIERQLDAVQLSGCYSPTLKADVPWTKQEGMSHIPEITKMHIDLAVAAMACDMTRVATMMLINYANQGVTMPWLGDEFTGPGDEYPLRDHHDITHRQGQSPEHTRRKIVSETWFMSQFAYVLTAMKRVSEPKADGTMGTMLDNSVVAILNSGSDGAGHTVTDMPWVIAGNCGGYFKTGRYLRYDHAPHNGLLVAFCNAMGMPRDYYGDPKYGGELPGLRG
jgi:hypothetical protein